jgi:H+/gluconate symporter-like permease
MLLTIFLFSQLPPGTAPIILPPPPTPYNRQWYEVFLDPPVLIPVIIGIVFSIFLFIFIFRYCNRERSESLSNVIDSIGTTALKLRGKNRPEEENNVIYIGKEEKKVKPPPSLKLK